MKEEDKLLKEAQKHYHREGGQYEAIRLYKILLEKYPDNIEAWSDLAAMQYDILDFDNAIRSSHKMLSLDPENSWNTELFLTKLKLLRKFKFVPPNLYLDEETREAHEIKELEGEFSLFEQIEKYSYKLLDLYKDNLKKVYELNFTFSFTLIEFGKYHEGLSCLNRALELKDYRVLKRRNPLPDIYNWMSTAYLGLKDYKNALKHLDMAFENGLDEYVYLKKADIYNEMGNMEMHNQIIEDFIKIVDDKIRTKPETAYISQKINAILKLGDTTRAEKALNDFEVLKPFDERTLKIIEEKKALINNKKSP